VLSRKPASGALGNADHPYGLAYPVAVTTDLEQRVWITDSGTASVHVFDPAGSGYREIRRLAGTPLQSPAGIASDSQGRIYLTDAATGGVFVFDEHGEYDHPLIHRGERLLESPSAIALSEDGKTIYVADPPRHLVLALNREGEVNSRKAKRWQDENPTRRLQ
jgi:DNA-binding beta-propeller fold protein YncE